LARGVLRQALAAAPAVAVVTFAWTLLEEPVSWWGFCAAAGLAVAPAIVRDGRRRAATTAVAVVAVLSLAFETWPHAALDGAWTALHEAPAVRAPFDPVEQPWLHGLVVLCAFGLALVASLGASARRPVLVGAAVAVGIGFPTVVLEDPHPVQLGAVALAAVLWASVLLGAHDARRGSIGLALAAVVVGSAGAIALAGVTPGEGRVDWRGWDPFAVGGRTADVRYVWDATYESIDFPARPTVVLRVRAPKRAEYWRVSTLESFTGDRWLESLYPIERGSSRRTLPVDPLVPGRDANRDAWLEQEVTIEGIEDARVPAASQPARIVGPTLGGLLYLQGGVMRARRPLRRGTEYTVWSYAPRPTPRELAGSPPRYPPAAGRYLQLGRTQFQGFGAAGREANVDQVFRNDQYRPLWPYRALWQEARRLTAQARSPYEATLVLERWFRGRGGFRYEEHPPRAAGGNPPLVDFVEVTRAGYCQHYAGAMAVMLRLLGIPARVAVGFTAGTWKAGVWTVTDQQAHAWVEAWFAGFGWLAFDPTPGRGILSAVYTLASDSADAVRALGTGRFLDFTPSTAPPATEPVSTSPTPGEARGVPWWVLGLLCVPLAAAALIVGVKRVRRAWRLGRREPRRLAAGVRAELVDALVDRGAKVDPRATTAVLQETAQRVLRLPTGALGASLAEARYGPPDRAEAAARRARSELRQVLGAAEARERPADRVRTWLSLRSLRPGLTSSAG
jgi:transglutaminase-like putative cysteine protease